jgi:hypothetical protein
MGCLDVLTLQLRVPMSEFHFHLLWMHHSRQEELHQFYASIYELCSPHRVENVCSHIFFGPFLELVCIAAETCSLNVVLLTVGVNL